VETLCNCLKRRAAAFILNMLKTNAAAWRLHSVLDSSMWGLPERREHDVGALRARCKYAL